MELKQQPDNAEAAFTCWECAAALLCVVLLFSVAFAALANSREPGNRAVCANNMRRLGNAALMYSSENAGLFPPRNHFYPTNWWPTTLLPFYRDGKILQCPSDVAQLFASPRGTLLPGSYLINGWNDYWEEKGVIINLGTNELALPEADIPQPSQTLLFGEKVTRSHRYHMDLFQGVESDTEESRHYPGPEKSGGSNYTFVDGSVRFLPPKASLTPLNLWAITDKWRTNSLERP